MKPPEPRAIQSQPPLEVEKTGTYRQLRFQPQSGSEQSQHLDIPRERSVHPSATTRGDESQLLAAEPPGESASVSEPRMRINPDPVIASPATIRPLAAVRHCRVLLAVSSEAVTEAFLPVLRALHAAVVQVDDGFALEHALCERGSFDLVLTDCRLPGSTGLSILAGMRLAGKKPPFVIVQSMHQHLLRVVVGGGERGALTTRVVNDLALIELAEQLTGTHEGPASSRRAHGIR